MALMELLGPLAELTILCLVLGLVFLLIEIFTPGFGVFGTLGFLFLLAVIVMQLGWGSREAALYIAAGVLVLIVAAILFIVHSLKKGRLSKSFLVLKDEIDASSTSLGTEQCREELLGKTGRAATMLRPSGIAEIDGKRLDVMTSGDFIPVGTNVVVTKVEGLHILVTENRNAEK